MLSLIHSCVLSFVRLFILHLFACLVVRSYARFFNQSMCQFFNHSITQSINHLFYQSITHSFLTLSDPQISCVAANNYGSPPACPVLRYPPSCEWKACKMQVVPDIIPQLVIVPLTPAIQIAKIAFLWQAQPQPKRPCWLWWGISWLQTSLLWFYMQESLL